MCLLVLAITVECNCSKGLRTSSLPTSTKVYALQNAGVASETLITDTLCYAHLLLLSNVIIKLTFHSDFATIK